MNRIIPVDAVVPAREQAPPGRGEALDVEWCAERASEALKYLAEHYPESGGSEALHPYQDAAHEAAVSGDRDAHLLALRGYMRAGRGVAMRVRLDARKGAA